MFADSHQPPHQQSFEVFEHLTVFAIHQVHVIFGQFEGRRFKVHAPWGTLQQKSEIDMQQVALGVNQNVSVVSISDLKHVVEQRIACEGFHEMLLGFFEILREVLVVKGPQGPVRDFLPGVLGELLFEGVH